MMINKTVCLFLVLLISFSGIPVSASNIETNNSMTTNLKGYQFTVAWVTDTQHIMQDTPEIWQQMVNYINQEAEEGKIHYVVHTGDLVQNWNNSIEWDQFTTHWDSISVDKNLIAGNHDTYSGDEWDEFDSRFPNRRYYTQKRGEWLFLFLSWAEIQNDTVKTWLRNVIESNDNKTVILTHYYMNSFGVFFDGWYIQSILAEFEERSFSVWCGHVPTERISYRKDNNTIGILHNFQDYYNGGNGHFVLADMYENGYYMRLVSPVEGHDGKGKGEGDELSVIFTFSENEDNSTVSPLDLILANPVPFFAVAVLLIIVFIILRKQKRSALISHLA